MYQVFYHLRIKRNRDFLPFTIIIFSYFYWREHVTCILFPLEKYFQIVFDKFLIMNWAKLLWIVTLKINHVENPQNKVFNYLENILNTLFFCTVLDIVFFFNQL